MAAVPIPGSGNQFSPFPPQVLYIDSNYVKQICPISQNVDESMLRPAIQAAQSKYIVPIIGSSQDGLLQQEILNGAISGDTWGLPLLNNFLMPTLAYWTAYEVLPTVMWQINNKGVQIKNSDYGHPPSKSDLVFMMQNFKDTAMYWSKRTTLFIQDNITQFPQYNNPGPHMDIINPNVDSYDGFGIHVPGKTRNGGFPNGIPTNIGYTVDISSLPINFL
jgi:hypothetical protein